VFERRRKVRRLRIALAALAALVLVVTGVLGGVATTLNWDGLLTPGPSWDDRYTIDAYELTGTLRADGTFAVTEDVTVTWHEPRRGLIRDLDLTAPDGRRMGVQNIEVTSRTQDDVWFEVERDAPDTASIHLGEEVDFRPLGTDHYRISYVFDGLLVSWQRRATLRWDTFGDQWDTLIRRATVTLELPAGDHELACVVGAFGEAFACTDEGPGPSWSATELRPGRGVTVEARLDPAAVRAEGLPRAGLGQLREFSRVAWQRLGLVVGLGVAAALPLVGSIGGPVARRRREEARRRIETTGVTYLPPSGIRPLTAGYLVKGEASSADDGQLFAAWLLDAQQRDLIRVREITKGFEVRAIGGTPDGPEEAAALRALVAPAGSDGWARWDKRTKAGPRSRFEKAWQQLRTHHAAEAGVPQIVSGRFGKAGALLAVGALAVGGILLWLAPPAAIAIGVGLFGAWGASAYVDQQLRTAVAYVPDDRLEQWRQLEGLRRFVDEAHAGQISGLAEDPNVPLTSPFLQLLPWVIAFGSGDRWAERFEVQLRTATAQRGVYVPVRSSDISTVRSVSRPASSGSGGGGGGSGVGSGGGGGGGSSR
jgi:uncharacterized membrane protein YgcG